MQSLLSKSLGKARPAFRAPAFSRCVSTNVPSEEVDAYFYYNRLFLPAGMLSKFAPASFFTPSREALKAAFAKHQKDAEILEVIPRSLEGGAFVKMRGDLEKMREAAARGFRRRWSFFPHFSQGFQVKGKPWITDMPRSSSRKLEITPKLPDEETYELSRPYGRIFSVQDGQVSFFSIQDAITAMYCTHRSAFSTAPSEGLTTVRSSMIQRASMLVRVKGWATSHPRVVIPLVFAFIFAMAYAVFEPVRELSIGMKIKGTLSSVEQYVQWARESSQRLISLNGDNADDDDFVVGGGKAHGWNNTAKSAQLLKDYIDEGASTFIVSTGPKGSGKSDIVDAALAVSKPYVLDIDCGKSRNTGDEEYLSHLASALGYWPVFLWTNRLLRAAESGVQGLTGQNPGITETTDQQARRILGTAAHAVRRVASRNLPSEQTSEGVYLETHPKELPVILLRGLSGTPDGGVDLMAEWAGDLIKQQIARVVIVTEEAAFDKRLSAALPNRVFRVVSVEDASPEAAKEYVMRKFSKQATTPEAKSALNEFASSGPDFLEPLGGRFTDLQSFGRRMLNGETPQHASKNLVHAAALEASQSFLTEGHNWTVEQAWTLVSSLASSQGEAFLSVPGAVTSQPAFVGADVESSLESLEQSGLVTLRSSGGRVTGVKPSRPLYRAAFAESRRDPLVSSIMLNRLAKSEIKRWTCVVKESEDELVISAQAMASGSLKEAKERQDFVAKKLSTAQANIMRYQQELAESSANLSQFSWYYPQLDGDGSFAKQNGSNNSHNGGGLFSFGVREPAEPRSRFE